jgi:hypothetical protein
MAVELGLELVGVVFFLNGRAHIDDRFADPPELVAAENGRTAILVEPEKVVRRHRRIARIARMRRGQTRGDDPAGGSSGDEIEVPAKRLGLAGALQAFLQFDQDRRRNDPADAAAVDRENESTVRRHQYPPLVRPFSGGPILLGARFRQPVCGNFWKNCNRDLREDFAGSRPPGSMVFSRSVFPECFPGFGATRWSPPAASTWRRRGDHDSSVAEYRVDRVAFCCVCEILRAAAEEAS